MYKSIIAAAATALAFTSSVAATPLGARQTDSGPKIVNIFFSDDNCTTTVPETIYTRYVYGDHACYNDFDKAETYKSLMILEIDDQFIGTNTALEIGNSDADTCDWTHSIKFNIATKDDLKKCQFVGIPGGMHTPLLPGNEYRLTSLE